MEILQITVPLTHVLWHAFVFVQLFNREGLASAWDSLVRDGEYLDECEEDPKNDGGTGSVKGDGAEGTTEEGNDKNVEEDDEGVVSDESPDKPSKKKSGFMPFLEEWTWGEVHTHTHILECTNVHVYKHVIRAT